MDQKERAVIDLIINGQQAKASLSDLEKAVRATRNEFKKLREDDDPQHYARKRDELKKLLSVQKEANDSLKETASTWSKFKEQIGGVAAGVAIGGLLTGGLQALGDIIPQMLGKMAELSDSFADIRKTTGMTSGEVARFNSELKNIDTRTATQDLREIAVVAGQLGIAKDDILGFTASVDKLNVALGDEFSGGASQVAEVTGKLRNIFSDIKSDKIDEDLLHIGNALNALGSTGAATGPVVADFANRIGGAGIQMGLTTAQVLGLSATLQELNVETERGGTAVTRILQKMLTHVEAFAAVAGVSTATFKKKLDTDLYGAFMMVTKAAGASSASATQFAEMLEALGIEGAGAMEVISKLSGNTDLLTSRVNLAAGAIGETSSVMNEFNLKNNNMAANMEKLSKRFASWWDKSAFMGFFEGLIGKLADTRSEAEKLAGAFQEQRTEVNQLESKLQPLIKRHDELQGKGKLNKEEQIELKIAISGIAELIPSAITQWDSYGKAIGVSTTKAQEFIKMQKTMLQFKNQDAISELGSEMEKMKKERERLVTFLNSDKRVMADDPRIGKTLNKNSINFSIKMLEEWQGKIAKLNSEIDKRETLLKGLKGDYLDVPKPPEIPVDSNAPGTPIKILSKADRKELDRQQEKAQKDAEDLAKELARIKDEQFKNSLRTDDAEVFAAQLKYEKLRKEALGNRDTLVEIANLEAEELNAILRKQADARTELSGEKAIKELLVELEAKKAAGEFGIATDSNLSDEEKDMLKLQNEEQYLMSLYMLKFSFGERDIQLEKQLADNYIAQQDRKRAKTSQDNEIIKTAEEDLAETRRQLLLDGSAALASFFGKNTAMGKAAMVVNRSLAIAGIIQNVAGEIAGYYKAYSLIPVKGPIIAAGYATAAKIRAGISIASIAAQTIKEFAGGGYTSLTQSNNPQGYVSTPTLFNGRYIAGEKGKEWIGPNWMITNPYTANIFGALEAMRSRGPAGISEMANKESKQEAGYDYRRLENMLAEIVEAVKEEKTRPAVLNYRLIEEMANRLANARNRVNN